MSGSVLGAGDMVTGKIDMIIFLYEEQSLWQVTDLT